MNVNNFADQDNVQLVPLQVAVDKVTEAGFLNYHHKKIQATSMLLSCRRLGLTIGATQPYDGYHWYIDLKKFTVWLKGFRSNMHIKFQIEGDEIKIKGDRLE